MKAFPKAFDTILGDEGIVVRRSWLVVPEGPERRPLLTGLFGFPWPERSLQAKCTLSEMSGRADLLGSARHDRVHALVPDRSCSCGIYAEEDARPGWILRRYLAAGAVVNGFVRLSGRILYSDGTYRAANATIMSPLELALPTGGLAVAGLRGLGLRLQPNRVTVDGPRYQFAWVAWGRGMTVVEWLARTQSALRDRYEVDVIAAT